MAIPGENLDSSAVTWRTRFQDISLRARLTIGVVVMTLVAIGALAAVVILNVRGNQIFLLGQLGAAVTEQVEQQLVNTAVAQASEADNLLNAISGKMIIAADYVSDLLAQQEMLGTGEYWDARQEMSQLSENQWGNGLSDPGSLLAPASFSLTEETALKINSTIYLDFLFPQMLAADDNLIALYYVNEDGATHYYPNIGLAEIVGDFDARERPYYTGAAPSSSPDRSPFWTVPYLDAALNGFIQTNSVPVYDNDGEFRGVVAADILLTTIANQVNELSVGETGYAFMLDASGNFVTLPEAGLADFGLSAADLPESGIPEGKALALESPLRPVIAKMINGKQGISRYTRDGVDYYAAFAPVQSAGFSLALVAPVTEMTTVIATTNNIIDQRINSLRTVIIFTTVILVALALAFSYFFGRLLVRPLNKLTQAAGEIAGGNYDVNVVVDAGSETRQLAAAFNSMTAQVRESVRTLEQRVLERTQTLATSTDVGRRLSTILDQDTLVSEVVNQIQTAFNFYHAQMYLLDETGDNLVMVSGTGVAGQKMLANEHTIPVGKGLVGRAAATNTSILVADVSLEREWIANALLPDTQSELTIPVSVGNVVLGVLDVQHNERNGLGQTDRDFLQSIANQVAIALRNAQLYLDTQHRAEQEAVINRINQEILKTTDMQSALQVAVRELGRATGAPDTRIRLTTNGKQDNEAR